MGWPKDWDLKYDSWGRWKTMWREREDKNRFSPGELYSSSFEGQSISESAR